MSRVPPVLKRMTPFPYSIDANDDIVDARAMMDEHGIHHLPVTDDGKIVGMLSESDIRAAAGAVDDPEDPAVPVRAVCAEPAYVVESKTPLNRVVGQMAERRLSTAVVVRDDKLVGILTCTDVCRFLAELLSEQEVTREGA